MSRGPEGGFDFGNKRHWRRTIYAFERRMLAHRPQRSRRALILEDSEGLEAEFLIRRGYRPDQIVAVNRNPAVLARMTMSLDAKGLPRVVTASGDAGEVARRYVKNGWSFDCINLDFTRGLDRPMMETLSDFRDHVMRDDSVISVNVLRGRETDDVVRAAAAVHRWHGRDAVASCTDPRAHKALMARLAGVPREQHPAMIREAQHANPAAFPPLPSTATVMDWARANAIRGQLQGGATTDGLEFSCKFHSSERADVGALLDPNAPRSSIEGSYRSGVQTLLWVALHVRAHRRGWANNLDPRLHGVITGLVSDLPLFSWPPCWVALWIAARAGTRIYETEVADTGEVFGCTYPVSELGGAAPSAVSAFKDQMHEWLPPRRRA